MSDRQLLTIVQLTKPLSEMTEVEKDELARYLVAQAQGQARTVKP